MDEGLTVAFLMSLGMWLLKLLLGGLFKDVQKKQAEAARREADAAKIAAESAQEAGDLEVRILEKQQAVDNLFKAKTLPPDDPFGFRDWNAGPGNGKSS